MPPKLVTARLILRPLTPADSGAIYAIMSDPEAMRFWDWPAFNDPETVRDIAAAQIGDMTEGRACYWAAVQSATGKVIGSCDLSEIDRHHARAEVGFLFNRAVWGNGYALEAMMAVRDYAFATLQLHRLWARIHSGNAASQKLLERLGFIREGVLRQHIRRDGTGRDCEIYGLVR